MGMTVDIPMPINCVDCDNRAIRPLIGCKLIFQGCANCGRHPNCPIIEAIPKADYEARLRADVVAMLTDMQLEFEEELNCGAYCDECHKSCEDIPAIWFLDFIQEKINALKGKGNNGNNVR